MPSRIYALSFSLDVPWHRHALEVHWLSARRACGYVVVDWSRSEGAGAGDGDADTGVHRVAFEADVDEDGCWRFDVVVGHALPRVYRFAVWPVGDALAGVVDVALDRADARARRLGVLARPTPTA